MAEVPSSILIGGNIFTARKQSLEQGNIFSSVCQEFCSRGGEYLGTYPPGQVHPTSPGRYTPWAGTPPLGRYTPRQVHRPSRYTPLQVAPPPEQCMLGDTGNKRAVRILLECILVYHSFVKCTTITLLMKFLFTNRPIEISGTAKAVSRG